MSCLNSKMFLCCMNDCDDVEDTATVAFHHEDSEAFHQEESEEELEKEFKRLHWSLQTDRYIRNSMRHICTLFGLDEIDGNFVMFLTALGRSVHTQNNFLSIVKRLRCFIIEEGGSDRISQVLQAKDSYGLVFEISVIEEVLRMIDSDVISMRRFQQRAIDFDMNDVHNELERHTSMTWNILPSGSSEMDQLLFRSDRDYLLWPTKVRCRIEFSKEWPCYCRVLATNKQELPLAFQDILDHENELTSSKYKEYIFPAFDSFMEEAQSNGCEIQRISNAVTSPAYTMKGTFLHSTSTGRDLHNEYDLVLCLVIDDRDAFNINIPLTEEELKQCNIYVVPKPPNEDVTGLWRISFSSLEQKIIRDGFSKEEKDCLDELKFVMKLMKMKNEDKDDWTLSSYHITSLLLNEHDNCSQILDYDQYKCQSYRDMINALGKRLIPHFFIPELNLMQNINDEECELFIRELEIFPERLSSPSSTPSLSTPSPPSSLPSSATPSSPPTSLTPPSSSFSYFSECKD